MADWLEETGEEPLTVGHDVGAGADEEVADQAAILDMAALARWPGLKPKEAMIA